MPFIILIFVVIMALLTMAPFYCTWLCPFKTVTEFQKPETPLIVFQTMIFVALFVWLVVYLPFKTKKRTQCGLFCPFGAMQSFTNKVNAFEITIDTTKCVKCGACIKGCPLFALDEKSLSTGHPKITCSKCGYCIDICPKGAANFAIKGVLNRPKLSRTLFLFAAFTFMLAIGGGSVQKGLIVIFNLLTTGRAF